MKPHLAGRLHAQGLGVPRFATAGEVVRHLGCVQSQLHDMALWAVARRMTGDPTHAELQASFDAGEFLRTHVLRPTWHFVDPADVHWLLALTGPRVERLMSASNRTIDLTPAAVQRGVAVVVAGLADGAPRTRAELAVLLREAGLPDAGQALAHVVMQAEIEQAVVNGPMRGKQHTYRLLPPAPSPVPGRDELLADVARRYARGHGSFRDKDLAWWTSLTLTDSRRAIELADLRPTTVDGDTYWLLDDPVEEPVPRVMLLSNFDEYISYARDPDDYAGFTGSVEDVMRASGLLLVDGRLAGRWSRTVTTKRVDVVVEQADGLTAVLRRHLEAEAAAFARYLQREPVLTIRTTK
ncbi:MAG: winged helix DNA-binding domain-containing protein [Aeromicrobium sp.]